MHFDRTYLRALMPETLVNLSNSYLNRSELEIVLTEHLEDALEGRSLTIAELKRERDDLEGQVADIEDALEAKVTKLENRIAELEDQLATKENA